MDMSKRMYALRCVGRVMSRRVGRTYSDRRCFSLALSARASTALRKRVDHLGSPGGVDVPGPLPLKLIPIQYTSASTRASSMSAISQRHSSTIAYITMSQGGSSSDKDWRSVSRRKKAEQNERIPKEWKLHALPGADVKSYIDIPRKSGLLTKEELDITERYDAVALAEAIRGKKLKCIDVTRAFCKVSRPRSEQTSW